MSYWTEVDPPMSFIPENWSYEQKRTFRYKCIDYLLDAIKFKRFAGKRVLCVGDGSGIDAVEFARHGADVYVIDMSKKAIELTLKHADEAGVVLGKVETKDWVYYKSFVGDICERTTWRDGHFDAVYSFGVLHHIAEVERAVSEIARVLKPGGTFLGMVYHKDSLLYAYSILLRAQREGLSPNEAMQKYSERNPGCPVSRAYTMKELWELLYAFSSRVINIQYPVIDLADRRKVRFDFLGNPELLGWHLLFEAVK